MARYNDGTTYNSGARYGVEDPRKQRMSQIKTGASQLTIPQKLTLGQNIITASTSNPNVPGNTAVLAAFSTTQTALAAKLAAAVAARAAAKTSTTEQKNALAAWEAKLVALAGFTQSATGGEAAKIESAGFAVRGTPAPVPVPGQVMSLNVLLNGAPGHSKLDWRGWLPGAGQPGPDHPDELDAVGDLDEGDLPRQWSDRGPEVLVSRGGLQHRGPGAVERAVVAPGGVKRPGRGMKGEEGRNRRPTSSFSSSLRLQPQFFISFSHAI